MSHDAYAITAVDVRDFKRIDHVKIEPGGDLHLLLIAGNNSQGKSSLLDALTAAFGGKSAVPTDPVRHGSDQAQITVELAGDRGRYVIRRTVAADGKQRLEIRGPDGVIASPQTWLDKLVGARFLDPLSFLTMDMAKQRQLLLSVAGIDTAELDAQRKRAYDKRTEVGRDLTKAKGEYARLPAPSAPPPEARPVSVVTAELAKVEESARDYGALRATLVSRTSDVQNKTAAVARLQSELRALQMRIAAAENDLRHATDERDQAETAVRERATEEHAALIADRRQELQAEIQRAETVARWQAATESNARRRNEAEAQIGTLSSEVDRLTKEIDGIDETKAAMLANAALPVADLGFTDDGVQLGGVRFDQASQSERLRCALSVAMRLSPNIRDVWVRDGSLLDEVSLGILRELAEANECRVWVERVGERDQGAVIIRDGRVATE